MSYSIKELKENISILKEAYKMYGLDVKSYSYAGTLDYIANCKCSDVSPEQALKIASPYTSEYVRAQVYGYYESRLNAMYALDFDDLLIFARRVLRMYPEIRLKWQKNLIISM